VFRALVIGVVAFCLSAFVGRPAVAYLRRRKIGKAISGDQPESHSIKAGTPTMGGILIFTTALVITAPFNLIPLNVGPLDLQERLSILLPFSMIAITGVAGFLDDLATLEGRARAGLSWRVKMLMLTLLGLVTGFVLWKPLDLAGVAIPYAGFYEIGIWIVPVSVLVVLGTTVGVAVTDGLDMLAGITTATAFAAYGVIAAFQGQPFLGAFCYTVVGATMGFLWYNAYPARVYMGDTGALALGSSLAVVALMTRQWPVLPLIGIVFLINALSDVIQIGYYKLSKGKRIFRRAPLHHHYEELGLHETQVTIRFWLIGVAGAMLGVGLAIKV
jgi:phospho-N-acetylmuramoyl-pentapeptide-transferase